MKQPYIRLLLVLCMTFVLPKVSAQRIVQDLDRGVVAIHSTPVSAFISWRLFATEPSTTGFNLYRSSDGGTPVKLNTEVLTQGTNFTDETANFTVSNEYFVKAVWQNTEKEASRTYVLPANTPVQSFYSVPLHESPIPYQARYVRVGDLDGDGDYDFVVVRAAEDEINTMIVEAYKQDGTYLWQLDCGPNSLYRYNNEPGSTTLDIGHGDNIMVYDINEDGKAEVIVRTANGFKFGNGSVLNYPENNNVQFISVLNGMTGTEMSRTLYNNPYLVEGPMNGHLGIAYLDGIHPSVVWEAKNRTGDEDFNEMTTAWDWKNGTLVQKWQFFLDQYPKRSHQQTGHQIRIIDLDGDGKDEICPQGFVIDDDGTLLYSLADKDIYHGDRFFIGDLDPNRPGLENYGIQQGYSTSGIMWYYTDAKTGEVLLTQKDPANHDMGRGNVGDFDPRFNGYEFHTFVDYLYNVSGEPTSNGGMPSSYPNFKIWWDGDLLTENLDNRKMTKWNYLADKEDRIQIDGKSTFSGHVVGPNTPSFAGDILGDWREEVIYESADFKTLMIYTTPIPTKERIYTLSQNPAYLNCFTVRGYYQGNMTDFYLGDGMQEPPLSPIQKADKYWEGTTSIWDETSTNWTSKNGSKTYADGEGVMFDIRGNSASTIQLNAAYAPAKITAMNPEGKDYTFSGTGKLTGTMEFVKSLAGAVNFNGNYDYTGATTVSDGTLNVNGTLASTVFVGPKGTIGGIGTYKGGVTLQKGFNINGGRINPGKGNGADLIGSLIIEGGLLVPGDNNFAFDIVPTSPKMNDSLIVKGDLNFSGKNRIIIKFKDDLPEELTYTLIKCTGTLTANAADFTVAGIDGIPNEILVENNEIKLKILSLREPGSVTWKGTVDNKWDVYKENFDLNGTVTPFTPKDNVLFDDSAVLKSVQLSEVVKTSGVTFDASSDYTINGTGSIAGTGDLIKNNTGSAVINLTKNTYTGKTIVNGGTLAVAMIDFGGNPSSIGSAANTAGNLVVNNAVLQVNQNSSTDRVLTITGNSTIRTPIQEKYMMFQKDVTGSGNLIKEGPGALYFLYNNSYTGETILKEGSIYLRGGLGNTGGLGTQGKLTIESGSLFMEDRRGNDIVFWNIEIPSGKSGTLTPDGRCTLNGTLTGSGTLTLNMPFIRTGFRGNWSAFSGTINVNGDFRIDNTFGYAKALVNLVGPFNANPSTAYSLLSTSIVPIGELNGVAASKLSTANWEIGARNTNSVFNGTIASTSVKKVGTGSLTLTGSNTYTGLTIVDKGELIINNTAGNGAGTGNLSVNNDAVLSGNGTLANNVTIGTGASLAPNGSIIGTLTVKNKVTFNTGSFYSCEVNSTSDTSDILATSTFLLTLNGVLKITNLGSDVYTAGDQFKIFTGTNITGNFSEIIPSKPRADLVWDTSLLKTTGIISIKRDPALPSDNVVPVLTSAVLTSSNSNTGFAKEGDIVTLNFKPSEEIEIPIVTIAGHIVTATKISTDQYSASYTMTVSDLEGLVGFSIAFQDLAGNKNNSLGSGVVYDRTKPALTAPSDLSLIADNNTCDTANVILGSPNITEANIAGTAENDAPSKFSVGTTIVTWTVKDQAGNSQTAAQNVVVKDLQKPLVTTAPTATFCFNENGYSIPELAVSDNCGIAKIEYTITGATERIGTGTDASGNFNSGVSNITWTVFDIHENQSTITKTVTIKEPIVVLIDDVYAVNLPGTSKNTIYRGYGPSTLKLTAKPFGGTGAYTFKWNNNQTGSSINVNAAGTYTVTITDSQGCTATSSIVIKYLDVRCGIGNTKVMVCHNGFPLCIASAAVQAHLNHGDILGNCEELLLGDKAGFFDESGISVYPNPSSGQFTLGIKSLKAGNATINITTIIGVTVQRQDVSLVEGNQTFSFDISRLSRGIYFVKVIGTEGAVTKIVVAAALIKYVIINGSYIYGRAVFF